MDTVIASSGIEPRSTTRIIADGRHNAFAAFTRWQSQYWLACRKATGHTSMDGEVAVLTSLDALEWRETARLSASQDDRDPQFAILGDRLWLYFSGRGPEGFRIWATWTGDGLGWEPPRQVYDDGYILWKPVAHEGCLYAGAHRPGPNDERVAELARSPDGIHWERVSAIRRGRGESETALSFAPAGRVTAFLRDQTTIGGAILEAPPPYLEWEERPAGAHLSGHSVYTFDGITYVTSRLLVCDPPVDAAAPRSALPAQVDQATVVYTYSDSELTPYCLLGPLSGNHDSSYATVVRDGQDMLIVYHRSEHVFAAEHRGEDAADLYLARVPLEVDT